MNASFLLAGFDLLLNDFTDTNAVTPNLVTATRTGNVFSFQLSEGVWTGVDAAVPGSYTIAGNGMSELVFTDLTMGGNFLNLLHFNDNTADTYDIQLGNLSVAGTLEISETVGSFGIVSQTMGSTLTVPRLEVSANSVTLDNVGNGVSDLVLDVTNDATIRSGLSLSLEGVTVGGNLSLTTTGNISQTAQVIVGNTLNLVAGGNICLTGGDGDLDGINDNNFGALVNASGTTVELVSSVGLTAGNITADTHIHLRSGAQHLVADATRTDAGVGDGAMVLTGVVETTNVAGRVSLQSDSGITQTGGFIETNGLLLGSPTQDEASTGTVTLNQANRVDSLAARLLNDLNLTNNQSLNIAALTYSSICGTMVVLPSASIGNNLTLNVTGNLTQSAAVIAAGVSNLTASGSICLTGGTNGAAVNANNFGTLVNASGTTVELVSSVGLTAGNITADTHIHLRSGARHLVADATRTDAGVGDGAMVLTGVVETTNAAGRVSLQSDDGITQTGGFIETNGLLLGSPTQDEASTGTVTLNQANRVDNLSARLLNDLSLTNNQALNIAALTYNSICGTMVDLPSASIGNNLTLNVTGDLTQSAAVIVAGISDLTASGNICLTGGTNGGAVNANDFGTLVTASGTTVELVSSVGLTAGDITADTHIHLRSGARHLVADATRTDAGVGDGAMVLTGVVETTNAAGRVSLQSDSGITQTGGFIETNGLLLGSPTQIEASTGTVTLNQANRVDNLSARLLNDLSLTNNQALNIAALTYSSACGTMVAICGLDIGQNLALNITNPGTLSQSANASVRVGGTTALSGSGIICWAGGDCTGDGLNDNAFGGQVTVNGIRDVVEIVSSTSLTISLPGANDRIYLGAGTNGLGTLTVIEPTLATLNPNGQILLEADSADFSTIVITTRDLMLRGGTFDLSANNNIQRFATSLSGDLTINSLNSLPLTTLTYNSVCGTNIDVCGLDVGGNLNLNVTGNITQELNAPIRVGGQSTLTATGFICLTGGDCPTLPGIGNDNDFVGQVTATGTTVEIVDINDLIVGDVTATNRIRLESGDGNTVPQTGSLFLNGVLTTQPAGQVLLQSDADITQLVGASIVTGDLLLQSTRDANSLAAPRQFDLVGLNQVARLAGDVGMDGQSLTDAADPMADLFGNVNLTLNNLQSLQLADLTYDSTGTCGTVVAICGLNVDGNLQLTVDGNLTQAANASIRVTGTTGLATTGFVCLTGGDCAVLPGIGNDNDFIGQVTASGTTVEIVDITDLTVGNVTATNRIRLESGDGSAVPQTGSLFLNGVLTTQPAGQVLLQSDADITQLVGASIVTDDLLLQSTRDASSLAAPRQFNLVGQNQVARLAGDVGMDGQSLADAANPMADLFGNVNLTLNNLQNLQLAELTYDSTGTCGTVVTICGLNVDGNLRLAVDGNLTQAANASIRVTGTADLAATGFVCMTGGDCAALPGIGNDNDFIGQVSASGTTVEIVDINDLTVGDVTATNRIRLESGNGLLDGNLVPQTGSLFLNGVLTTQPAGQVLLQSDADITQLVGASIVTGDLLLQSTRDASSLAAPRQFDLVGQNQVARLAGDVGMDGQSLANAANPMVDLFGNVNLTLNNLQNVQLADLTYDSTGTCGTLVAICGLNVDGNLRFTGGGNLTQAANASIRVIGTTDLATTGFVCLTGGDCAILPGIGNDNDFIGQVTASGTTVEIVDINDLNVGNVTATNRIRLESGDGLLDGNLVPQTGSLFLNGVLTTQPAGQVLLQSDADITQLVGASIVTGDLLLQSTRDANSLAGPRQFDLIGQNQVARLAGDVGMDGQTLADAANPMADLFGNVNLTLNNLQNVQVADLTYDSTGACGTVVRICGLDVDGDLLFTGGGNLTQAANASIRVIGTTDLTTTGFVCLTGGDCATLPGIGNDNDFIGQVTASGTTVEIVDINDLNVGNVTATNRIRLESGDGSPVPQTGSLFLNGVLTTLPAGQVLLQSDADITQLVGASIVTGDLLLQSTRDANSLAAPRQFDLVGQNQVARLAGDVGMDGQSLADAADPMADLFGNVNLALNNLQNVQLADLTYDSTGTCGTVVPICGLNVDGNLQLTVVGNLTQATDAAIRVTGTTDLTTTGFVCLTGGDCATLPGIGNDNDLIGQVTATGTTVEIVDINDLTVGNVTATNRIRLESGDGNAVPQTGSLFLNGVLTTQPAGQVLLQSDADITQLVGASIVTDDLLLQSTRDASSLAAPRQFNLVGQNQVARLAGDVGMDGQSLTDAANPMADLFGNVNLTLNNLQSLQLADLTYDSTGTCGTVVRICGLDVDGNLQMAVVGNLTQAMDASIRVTGTTDLATTGFICLTGGDCAALPGIGNDNDFIGQVTASGTTVEIVDTTDLVVGNVTATNRIRLESGDGSGAPQTGSMFLNGVLSTQPTGQVLLQSDARIVQAATSEIVSRDLLLQSTRDVNSAGVHHFSLVGNNRVSRLAGETEGSLELKNVQNLTVTNLNYSSVCGTNISIFGLTSNGTNATDAYFSNTKLAETMQLQAGTNGLAYRNENFTHYGVGNAGIAIKVDGRLTVDAAVTSNNGNIYLETVGGDLEVRRNIAITDPLTKMTLVAGAELRLEAQLLRGPAISYVGRVTHLDMNLTLPPAQLALNSTVDLVTFLQKVYVTYGNTGTLERTFDARILWGYSVPFGAAFSYDGIAPADRMFLQTFFAAGSSQSLFNRNPAGTGALATNGQEFVSDMWALSFLQANPSFTNVFLLFNDPGINVFSRADSPVNFTDHNISAHSFGGSAGVRLPIVPPPNEIEPRPLFTPVEMPAPIIEIMSEVQPTFVEPPTEFEVQVVSEYIIIFVPNQADLDKVDELLIKFAQEEAQDQEAQATDPAAQSTLTDSQAKELEELIMELGGKSSKGIKDRDVLRLILENADVDPNMSFDQFKELLTQLLEKAEAGERVDLDQIRVPRGIFKIIENPGGNGNLDQSGDDIDRRFLLEAPRFPSPKSTWNVLPPAIKDRLSNSESLVYAGYDATATEFAMDLGSDSFGSWTTSSVPNLSNQQSGTDEIANLDFAALRNAEQSTFSWAAIAASGLLTAGLLASQVGGRNDRIERDWRELQEQKDEAPDRNPFSRAARFARRQRLRC